MPITEGAPLHGSLANLLPSTFKSSITAWLAEDTPTFDYGGFVVGSEPVTAHLLAKSPGLLAGVPFFDEVFAQLGCQVTWLVPEGEDVGIVERKQVVAKVVGPARCVLLGERVALNLLARCSGVATASRNLLSLLRAAGYKNALAGTRKTTPGFRLVEKYGMLVGGCDPHRMDLSAMTMLKDNHVWACGGSIATAVQAAKAAGGFAVKVEVECQSEEEAEIACRAGADVVMLDNFTPEGVAVAAASLKSRWAGRVLVEVSGGLTEGNVAAYGKCEHVDVISSSAIHQGVKHVDFSLKVVPVEKAAEVKGNGESVAV